MNSLPSSGVLGAPLAGLLVAALVAPRRSELVRERPLTFDELRLHALNHTCVHVGGQHRGGTTLLALGLATYDAMASQSHSVGGAGSSDANARELHGEGLFLQDVYPRMSLDHPPLFFVRRRLRHLRCALARALLGSTSVWAAEQCRSREGMGGYAFGPVPRPGGDADADQRAAHALLSQWSWHWGDEGMRRPWLLEKSPSNALVAPWLSTVWSSIGMPARFIFISRHPLMQSMAMRAFVDDMSLPERLAHWVRVEEAARASARGLPAGTVALTSLEALATSPAAVLTTLLCWLHRGGGSGDGIERGGRSALAAPSPPTPTPTPNGASTAAGPLLQCGDVPAAAASWPPTSETAAWLREVRAEPNARYAAEYRAWLRADGSAPAVHAGLVRTFDARVGELAGYQLDDPVGFGRPPARDAAWLAHWLGEDGLGGRDPDRARGREPAPVVGAGGRGGLRGDEDRDTHEEDDEVQPAAWPSRSRGQLSSTHRHSGVLLL